MGLEAGIKGECHDAGQYWADAAAHIPEAKTPTGETSKGMEVPSTKDVWEAETVMVEEENE